MDWSTILFYTFSAILLFSAFRVITSRNTVHATLYLMLAFFQAALVWMLLKAEFLSIVLVLVYLGAVMVLFLFVVMMLDINVDAMRAGFWKNLPVAALLGALMAGEIAAVVYGDFGAVAEMAPVPENNTLALGRVLYTEYLYPVQIAGALLLLAIVAAIALTLRERKDSKKIAVGDQVRVRRSDRVRLVKVEPVKPAAASSEQQEIAP
jgi:NADH-quinone oxidoreductase subunit J